MSLLIDNLSAYANNKVLFMYINDHQFAGEYFEAAAIKKRSSGKKYTQRLFN